MVLGRASIAAAVAAVALGVALALAAGQAAGSSAAPDVAPDVAPSASPPSPPPAVAGTAPASPADALPAWLSTPALFAQKVRPYIAPTGIWRVRYGGQPAYLARAPCCDQFNRLFGADGRLLCAPSGGFTGQGDGQCRASVDASVPPVQVWWPEPAASGAAGAAPAASVPARR